MKISASEFRKKYTGEGEKGRANALTKAIIEWVNYNGGWCWRNNNHAVYDKKIGTYRKNPNQMNGVSDILGLWDGKFLAIEVKAGSDRLSDDQKIFLERVREAGGYAMEARSVDDVINYFTQI